MIRFRRLVALAAPILAAPLPGAATAPPSSAPSSAPGAALPERLLHCTLRRMTNLDPSKEQTNADIVFEGNHPFELLLAAAPARTAPPPEATDPPEPVDPHTRIVADPDGLTAGFPKRFDRVVDLWPQRVELTTTVDDPMVNLIIVTPIDEITRTANIFMTRATDVATYDLAHVYSGPCTF